MNTENTTAKASIRIRKPVAEVYKVFADAECMSRFWFTRKDDGLAAGKPVTFFMGSGPDAFSFDVLIRECREPHCIVFEWEGPDGNSTVVTWSFDGTEDGDTILRVEETGFTGTPEDVQARALDSTGGFNQVVVAAKAFAETGVAINVVSDHA